MKTKKIWMLIAGIGCVAAVSMCGKKELPKVEAPDNLVGTMWAESAADKAGKGGNDSYQTMSLTFSTTSTCAVKRCTTITDRGYYTSCDDATSTYSYSKPILQLEFFNQTINGTVFADKIILDQGSVLYKQ
jgi:hypothetical protein